MQKVENLQIILKLAISFHGQIDCNTFHHDFKKVELLSSSVTHYSHKVSDIYHLEAILSACALTFFLAYGISSDILSGILPGISSEILCG